VTKATAYFRFRVSPFVAQYPPAMLRFHSPLVEPDRRFSRIRLSDKDREVTPLVSRLGTRKSCCTEAFFAVACNAFHDAWASSGGRLTPIARPLVASGVVLELRPLRSTGVTRLQHYYEPLRHPTRPRPVPRGCPVAGHAPAPLGLPVLHWFPLANMPSPLPRWTCGGLSLSRVPQRRPSPLFKRVGVHVILFEACSAFTQVTACLLAESLNDPFHRRLRRLRYLHRRSDCFRLERPVTGWDLNPLKTNTFPQRTE